MLRDYLSINIYNKLLRCCIQRECANGFGFDMTVLYHIVRNFPNGAFLGNWISRKATDGWPLVIFWLGISKRNSLSSSNGWIQITSRYWIGFYPNQANKVNEKTTAEEKQFKVVSAAQRFTYKVKNIPIGEIHSVRLSSGNVWISRSLVITVLTGCSSTDASAKLYRTA